jgi:hypothetical protein
MKKRIRQPSEIATKVERLLSSSKFFLKSTQHRHATIATQTLLSFVVGYCRLAIVAWRCWLQLRFTPILLAL